MHWKKSILFLFIVTSLLTKGQIQVDFSRFDKTNTAKAFAQNKSLSIIWPTGKSEQGKVIINLENKKPLFRSIQLSKKGVFQEIVANLDPVFLLNIGKRDLISQNGWNIFFDTTNRAPHKAFVVNVRKHSAEVITTGSRTVIKISEVNAGSFSGVLEITFYNGSPMLNIAAVMSTEVDSTAILYDAGLVCTQSLWSKIAWSNTNNELQSTVTNRLDTAKHEAVKYRTIIGENNTGSLALFPPPHQYFYPLDEAFNLKFTWYGSNYRNMIPAYGIGIRQDPMGDNRWVPWFNAPPKTEQRLSFFCFLSTGGAGVALEEVKKVTHNDAYQPLRGYKTLSSHFHNEYVMKVLLPARTTRTIDVSHSGVWSGGANKPAPDTPNFVRVFKKTGINIVHLAEFHYTAHPKGPDKQRLLELKTLFDMCQKYSDTNFLLLPGEEPNEFFDGHWLQLFPKPVYWIMSRKPDLPVVTTDSMYGTVYRIGNKNEMLQLLERENGLAWTAHPRTKGSTGYPDKYKNEIFFTSSHFFGAAWKAMPADLSQPRLGKRVLDLLDDMCNWGYKKNILAEADLFTVEPENEMYAHLNVNYLQLDQLPDYKEGWQSILDAMRQGKFFATTGEILLPRFTVNGKGPGQTATINEGGKTPIVLEVYWTFPLQFAEIISGDGEKVFRERINLSDTRAFGKKKFIFNSDLTHKKWVRVEVWDAAVNGAFTQPVWLQQ